MLSFEVLCFMWRDGCIHPVLDAHEQKKSSRTFGEPPASPADVGGCGDSGLFFENNRAEFCQTCPSVS